jgi:hypothetical protein
LTFARSRWRWNAGEEGTPMLRVVTDGPTREHTVPLVLDEIVREGARRMLAAALEAEVDAYIEAHADECDGRGRRLVVRNGHAEGRSIMTGAGPVEIEAPRVNDRRVDDATGERVRFRSSIVAPWCRNSPWAGDALWFRCEPSNSCWRPWHLERLRDKCHAPAPGDPVRQ